MEQDYWLPINGGSRIRMSAITVVTPPIKIWNGEGYQFHAYDMQGEPNSVGPFSSEKAASDFIRNRFPTIELEG